MREALKAQGLELLSDNLGEYDGDRLPHEVAEEVPFQDGPASVDVFAASKGSDLYVVGWLEVTFRGRLWALPGRSPEEARLACAAGRRRLEAQAAQDDVVLPLEFDETDGHCGLAVALKLLPGERRSAIKERLAVAFSGVEGLCCATVSIGSEQARRCPQD